MKLLTPELLILAQMCTKSFVSWGFAPDPTGGAYSAPPDPLAALRGPISKGWGGEGREGWGWEGRDGRVGRGGASPPPIILGLEPPLPVSAVYYKQHIRNMHILRKITKQRPLVNYS